MQKHVNLVDLVKSFPTHIFLQNLASIQKRTIPLKFAHLTEKSEKGSISNLSTKAATRVASIAACQSRSTARLAYCDPPPPAALVGVRGRSPPPALRLARATRPVPERRCGRLCFLQPSSNFWLKQPLRGPFSAVSQPKIAKKLTEKLFSVIN